MLFISGAKIHLNSGINRLLLIIIQVFFTSYIKYELLPYCFFFFSLKKIGKSMKEREGKKRNVFKAFNDKKRERKSLLRCESFM